PASAPVDLDGEVLGLTGGERVEGVRTRQVRPAEHDLLLLHRDRPPEQANLRAGTGGVRWCAAQPHGDARGARDVAEYGGGRAEPVDHDVQRSVTVQVGRR